MPVEGYDDGQKFSPRNSALSKEIGRVKVAMKHNVESGCLDVIVAQFDELDKLDVGNDPLDSYVRLCLLPNEETKVPLSSARYFLFLTSIFVSFISCSTGQRSTRTPLRPCSTRSFPSARRWIPSSRSESTSRSGGWTQRETSCLVRWPLTCTPSTKGPTWITGYPCFGPSRCWRMSFLEIRILVRLSFHTHTQKKKTHFFFFRRHCSPQKKATVRFHGREAQDENVQHV